MAAVDVCFAMFDTEGRGQLSKEGFEKMLQTSVNLNLNLLLSSSVGSQSFERQAECAPHAKLSGFR